MREKKFVRVMLMGAMAATATLLPGGGAVAQIRGGPPREIPMPRLPPVAEGRGRPEIIGRGIDNAMRGLARAQQRVSERLSSVQRKSARELVRQYPADYDLDRNGALAIRGEVLATNLSDRALAAARRAGFTLLRRQPVDELGLSVVVLAHPSWSVAKMVDKLRAIAPDATVEPDHVFAASGGGAAALASVAEPVSAPPGAGSWRVGIIDTGAARIAAGGRVQVVQRGFAPGGAMAGTHGTAVASLVASHTADEAAGGASGTLLIADIFGSGRRGGTAELMVHAMAWLARQQVPVINVSVVGPYNGIVASAVSSLTKRGTLVVAPVGNDGPSARPLYPASLEGVVAVTAVDNAGQLLPEASRVARVDFAAPGVAVVRGPSGRPMEMRGTSFASPLVAHRLAELLPAPEPNAARRAVEQLAGTAWKPKRSRRIGNGVIGLPVPRAR